MGVKTDNEKGATMVEFAIVAPFLILFIFLAIDMLYLCYRAVSLQYTVSTVFRETVIGIPEGTVGPYNHGITMENRIKDLSASFGIVLDEDEIDICTASIFNSNAGDCDIDPNNPAPPFTGDGGEPIVININHQTRVLFLDTYNLRATAIGRNEPFSQ